LTILLQRDARPAHEKLKEITGFFERYLSTCEKVTASLSGDRVLELGNRTANIKDSLLEYAGDASVKAYGQAQADESGKYAADYNMFADWQSVISEINTIRDAVKLIDLSSAVSLDANGRPVWPALDTSSLVTAVAGYKALVTNA